MLSRTTLAELATTRPAASRVFSRYGLDYCCGGRRSLEDACVERGLAPTEVLEAIVLEEATTPDAMRWDGRPLASLVTFIVDTYHRRLRAEVPELVMMADRVEERHGDKASCPRGLRDLLQSIDREIADHLDKEEGILFPLILSGHGRDAAGPIHVMEREHDAHGDNLARLRTMTSGYVPPPEACATWRALYARLAALEAELMEHIHLENNVLFRRVLAE